MTPQQGGQPCCESIHAGLELYAPLKLTIAKIGDNLYIYATNQSRNIIKIKRIILGCNFSYGQGFLYLRKNNFVVSDQIEQNTTYLMYICTWQNILRAEAEAEYIEFTGRSVSRCYNL